MAINVTKPSVNLREKLNELETNKGLKGNEILQAETAQEVRSLIGAGRKNLIINGGFDVWQRGTSFASISDDGYSADRFKHFNVSATTTTSQQLFTNGQTEVPLQPTYFSRSSISANTNSSSYSILAQHIEDVRVGSGQTVTVSFWAKSSVSGNKIGVEFNQTFGSGGSARVTSTGGAEAVTLSTTWQKFTITKEIGSVAGKTIGASSFFEMYLWMTAGSSWNTRSATIGNQSGDFDVANVQLELGSVATDFEHRSYGEELALCQRYYFLTGKDSKHLTHFGFTRSGFLSYIYGTISYPCEMRDLPTLSWGGSIGGKTFTGGYEAKTGVTALVNDTSGTKQGGFRATFSTSWAAGDEAYLYDTDGTGYIAFDAEL
jgi:hypothetical protein